MKKLISFLLLLSLTVASPAAVMQGPDGRWYGNICMNSVGWQVVPWQLLGSMCVIRLPGHQPMQGIIINA